MEDELFKGILDIDKSTVVMVVDDDDMTRDQVAMLLGDSYTITGASSGQECLDRLERERPSLVLLDIQMPEMGGFEVMERIKQGTAADIPIIFLTGEHDAKVHAEGLAAGAVDYIEKPAHPLILRSRVEKALELDAARRLLLREIEEKDAEIELRGERVRDLAAKVASLRERQFGMDRARK